MTRVALALAGCAAGCFSYAELPNNRPDPEIRKLADATILDMEINLHKQPGLCPGHEGKLYVKGTVQWPKLKPVLRSLGSDIDSFDPASFAIAGPLLTGDAQAHLHPDPDVQKSIEDGFVIDVAYKPQPKFKFHQMFPPEYSCFLGSFLAGGQGQQGAGGNGGDPGEPGQSGGHGGHGGPGATGENGGRIQAFVTVVSTKFYPRLYAVMANDAFYLAPAERKLTFAAVGGAGGPGGGGGGGGNGGDQNTKSVERGDGNGGTTTVTVGDGPVGNGGGGGNGGDGGLGGNGGTVEVTYDSAFPELQQYIAVDVSGGEPGPGGAAGPGGAGGGTAATENAQQGQAGPEGQVGRAGQAGREGRASVRGGAVATMFRSIHGIEIASGGGVQPARDAGGARASRPTTPTTKTARGNRPAATTTKRAGGNRPAGQPTRKHR